MNSIAETNRGMLFLMKYMFPALLFAGSGTLLVSAHPSVSVIGYRSLLESPFLLWGMFLVRIGEVKINQAYFEYRRFHKWRRIAFDSVQRCEVSIHPGLGFVVLKDSRKRLYFVELRPAFERSKDIVNKLNERLSSQRPHERLRGREEYHGKIGPSTLCVAMCLLGILYGIFVSLRFPETFRATTWATFPHLISILMDSFILVQTWPWIIISLAALLTAILLMRFRKRSWVLALVFGTLIARFVIQIWR